MWKDGVLMCTISPCRMHIEVFECSNSNCSSKVLAEGRDHYIVIDRVSSAATHALIRRELFGVAISNGTLTGRLNHFHSFVTANAFVGVIPEAPVCRSVRTLLKLCSITLRLICMSPAEQLFQCNVCEFNGNIRVDQINALCMDGISQGFVKTGTKPFTNISEPCISLKNSNSAAKGRAEDMSRPLTCFTRELLDAIRGNSQVCTSANEKDFASAARMVSEIAVPAEYFSSISVCGKTRGDVSEDIGEN